MALFSEFPNRATSSFNGKCSCSGLLENHFINVSFIYTYANSHILEVSSIHGAISIENIYHKGNVKVQQCKILTEHP